jgi:hypothetical protein
MAANILGDPGCDPCAPPDHSPVMNTLPTPISLGELPSLGRASGPHVLSVLRYDSVGMSPALPCRVALVAALECVLRRQVILNSDSSLSGACIGKWAGCMAVAARARLGSLARSLSGKGKAPE